MAETHVKGLADLQRFLDTLPAKLERNVVRGAMRAAARTALPVARGNINSVSGELAESLKVGARARGGVVTGYVSTKVFYARFVEYGTKPHMISARDGGSLKWGGIFVESVEHPGARPAAGVRGFMRAALDSSASAAVLAAGEYMKQRLATKHGLDTSEVSLEIEE
jgi:hypothetical protein